MEQFFYRLKDFIIIFKNHIKFFWIKYLKGYDVKELPFLDQPSLELFNNLISRCEVFIEYGIGGSTILAAGKCKKMISVESDNYFLKAVQKKNN